MHSVCNSFLLPARTPLLFCVQDEKISAVYPTIVHIKQEEGYQAPQWQVSPGPVHYPQMQGVGPLGNASSYTQLPTKAPSPPPHAPPMPPPQPQPQQQPQYQPQRSTLYGLHVFDVEIVQTPQSALLCPFKGMRKVCDWESYIHQQYTVCSCSAQTHGSLQDDRMANHSIACKMLHLHEHTPSKGNTKHAKISLCCTMLIERGQWFTERHVVQACSRWVCDQHVHHQRLPVQPAPFSSALRDAERHQG